MRGVGVFSIILFIAGFVGLLSAVFLVVNAENMAGKKAQETAEKILLDLAKVVAENEAIKKDLAETKSELNKYDFDWDAAYQKSMAAILKTQNENQALKHENEKLHQKINWVEVKLNAQNQKPQRIILSQETPLKVSMIYKRVPTKSKEQLQRESLIRKTKGQIQELSK